MKEQYRGRPTQADKILHFYQHLDASFSPGAGIEIMNPYNDPAAWSCVTRFYQRFYGDHKNRKIIFGINPGRFGAGITGVPFTDPIRLANVCAIENNFQKRIELSSIFIYDMIEAYGGPGLFFNNYFITALSPLGFVRDGRNLNYYDDKALIADSEQFIINSVKQQIELLNPGPVAWCLGEGTNFTLFRKLNKRFRFFKEIRPLPHPRWIMQYRRKSVGDYIEKYLDVLK
ncbi:MAG TPA: uracil-DNA glycosylase family protein [Flavitalea sp.]|nr:uracil-DNA glycosylase family protein [Flavitalea sp.]